MKYFLLIIASVFMFVLSGCMTVCETESPSVTTKFSSGAKLRLEGFQLQTLRATQHHVGYSTASAYNYKTNSWASGGDSYSGATYERLPDEYFSSIVKDIFEFCT